MRTIKDKSKGVQGHWVSGSLDPVRYFFELLACMREKNSAGSVNNKQPLVPMICPVMLFGTPEEGARNLTTVMTGQLPIANNNGPTNVLGTTPGNSKWSY